MASNFQTMNLEPPKDIATIVYSFTHFLLGISLPSLTKLRTCLLYFQINECKSELNRIYLFRAKHHKKEQHTFLSLNQGYN